MPDQPFESWKRSPPTSAKEEAAADLLKQVGDAERLSPQAMHRVERQLRSARSRPFWLGGLGLATAAAGGLAVALIAVVTVRLAGTREHPSARATLADRTVALNDHPPPPEVPPEPRERVDENTKSAPEQVRGQPTERPRLRAFDAKKAFRKANVPAAEGQGAGRMLDEEAAPSPLAKAEVAAAPSAAASRAASAPSSADVAVNSKLDADSCKAAVPRFSTTLARNSGDVEQALIGRARCRLLLGQRQAGLADLTDYLMRFPGGRFAATARAMLTEAQQN